MKKLDPAKARWHQAFREYKAGLPLTPYHYELEYACWYASQQNNIQDRLCLSLNDRLILKQEREENHGY